MSRRKEIDRKKKLLAELRAGNKSTKAPKKKEVKIDADVNKDGKVDEKDVEAVKKKIKKKKK